MIVSDSSLRELLARGQIVVEPLEDFQIQPASIDLRLGDHFLKIDENSVESITLELYNANRLPIRLVSGRRICQIVFARMDGPASRPYAGKYQNQRDAVGSRVFQDPDG